MICRHSGASAGPSPRVSAGLRQLLSSASNILRHLRRTSTFGRAVCIMLILQSEYDIGSLRRSHAEASPTQQAPRPLPGAHTQHVCVDIWYIHMYIYIYMYTYTHIHIIYLSLSLSISISTYVSICIYMYMYVNIEYILQYMSPSPPRRAPGPRRPSLSAQGPGHGCLGRTAAYPAASGDSGLGGSLGVEPRRQQIVPARSRVQRGA